VGVLVAIGAWLWRGIPILGLVLGLAMAGNLVAAGLAGTLVPLTLKWLKLDPALASAVIVTTVTDCVGFGLFLGLATLFLPYLQVGLVH
jgi:magnesium transporter